MSKFDTEREFDAFYSGYLSGLALAYETIADKSSNVNQLHSCITKCSDNNKCISKCVSTYNHNQEPNPDKTHDMKTVAKTMAVSDNEKIVKISDHMAKYVTGKKSQQYYNYFVHIKDLYKNYSVHIKDLYKN